MSKKGETGEQDRGKPQPQKKKDRDAKRKDKKSAILEIQKSRQNLDNYTISVLFANFKTDFKIRKDKDKKCSYLSQ